MKENTEPIEGLARGDRVRVQAFGRHVDAIVEIAAGNGRSLMVSFDALLGGYVGMMPLLWSQDRTCYQDLIRGEKVVIETLEDES
jgi:hypothetical protein